MFAKHFSRTFSVNNISRVNMLEQEYVSLRANYSGFPLIDELDFDTELVSRVILDLKCGKAADIDGLSAEHLIYSHPKLSVILSKMFRLILLSHRIPIQFKNSYMVPIPKGNNYISKVMTCDDFRAIAVSPILSKVFEYSFLDRFGKYLGSADNQFGFKKGVGCSHAIYTCRNIVDRFVQNGSTVNICAIDLSKAFDKVNHHALFIKLMEKHVPVIILDLLENLLSCCTSCVKWKNSWSENFEINFGVRQGSVLSPLLFALYIDDLANLHCPERGWFILLYADDILLMTSSVTGLQQLLHKCERELYRIDMAVNYRKSACMRIGPRNNIQCTDIVSLDGVIFHWVSEIKYLGINIVTSKVFKCSFDQTKRSFYRVANSIFGKVGRIASEEVTLQLISCKCMPILLYGLEACPLNKSDLSSLDFTVNRFFMKLFRTSNMEIIKSCQSAFNFVLPSAQIAKRRDKFVKKI